MNEEVQPLEVPVDADLPKLPMLGELLIAARERCNLSAADLARQLRLALRQVQALEENRFDDLPGNTFVRGFVRNYARVVQSEPEAFLEAYERCRPRLEQSQIERRAEQIPFPRKTAPKWLWYLAVLLLLLLVSPLLVYLALHEDEVAPKRVKPASATASMAPKPVVDASVTLPPPQALLQHIAPGAASGTQVTAAIAPEKPVPTSPTIATHGSANVQMNFDGDAWVEIRDKSGKIVFSKLNRRGEEQVVQGMPPLSVVVGNAEQVRIAYNGKPFVLTPFTKVNVARFTLE